MGKFVFFCCFLDYILFFSGALAIKESDPAKYNDVIRSHKCEKTYKKSTGTIEADAVFNIFKRSVSKYEIYYTNYVGDGDSKMYTALSKTISYPDIIYFILFQKILLLILQHYQQFCLFRESDQENRRLGSF